MHMYAGWQFKVGQPGRHADAFQLCILEQHHVNTMQRIAVLCSLFATLETG